MGLILDTGLLVRAERAGESAELALERLARETGNVPLGISVVTLAELSHGVPRAKTDATRLTRTAFLRALAASVPHYGVDEEIAIRSGLIEGALKNEGFTIGFADALIAATALIRGDAVATTNAKHFTAVTGLEVVELYV